MTTSPDEHIKYTRNEWANLPYYRRVINHLIDAKIRSYCDIGANIGEVCQILFESIPTLRSAVLIEPQSGNAEYLRGRFANRPEIAVEEFGVYYGQREAILYQDPNYRNIGAFTVEKIQQHFAPTNHIAQLRTLEELKIDPQVVDFLKMDVEGAEFNIIPSSPTLKDFRFIEIEFHRYDLDLVSYVKYHLPRHKIVLHPEDTGNHMLLELS